MKNDGSPTPSGLRRDAGRDEWGTGGGGKQRRRLGRDTREGWAVTIFSFCFGACGPSNVTCLMYPRVIQLAGLNWRDVVAQKSKAFITHWMKRDIIYGDHTYQLREEETVGRRPWMSKWETRGEGVNRGAPNLPVSRGGRLLLLQAGHGGRRRQHY
jgi:hypothetical protein